MNEILSTMAKQFKDLGFRYMVPPSQYIARQYLRTQTSVPFPTQTDVNGGKLSHMSLDQTLFKLISLATSSFDDLLRLSAYDNSAEGNEALDREAIMPLTCQQSPAYKEYSIVFADFLRNGFAMVPFSIYYDGYT